MTEIETQHNKKTPAYTLRAIKAYTDRNPELTKQRNRDKYLKLTPEQKETYKIKRQHSRANMTQEQRDTYNAKQRQYYQLKKNKQQNITEQNDTTLTDIPIQNLNISDNQ